LFHREASEPDWQRSKPNATVYLPKEGEHHDGDNEMFIVFKAPKSEELLGMWTQSSVESRGDHRIMLARASDGHRWSQPQRIIGTTPGTRESQVSWGVPIVARTGRTRIRRAGWARSMLWATSADFEQVELAAEARAHKAGRYNA